MADYIDREEAKGKMAALVPFVIDESNSQFVEGLTVAYETICALPAADVKPVVHGEWVYLGREEVFDISGVRTWGARYQCRSCGFEPIFIEDHGIYDFCPNCGADMRGNDNERE